MGGKWLLNTAVTEVKSTFTLNSQERSRIGLVPDTLACIFPRLTKKTIAEAAESALEWHQRNLREFAFVSVPGEGLAKCGKEKRGMEEERQVLTPVVPMVGPDSYQGARAAEQALLEFYSNELVGPQKIRKFNVLKGIGDADGYQAYLVAHYQSLGIPCFDPKSRRANPSAAFHLDYKPEDDARIPLLEWSDLEDIVSSLDLDRSTNLPTDHPFFSPPIETSPSPDTTPLSILPLSLDRDFLWSDAPILAISTRTYGGSTIVDYVDREKVWNKAGELALAKYEDFRTRQLNAIRSDPQRSANARSNPSSRDGRTLASASYTFSLDEAMAGVAFATASTGDFGGLKAGTKFGILSFLYLYFDCQGDLGKIWETLKFMGIDGHFVRGFRSFLLPFIRQTVVIGVPSDPSTLAREERLEDGSSSLKAGIFLYANEIASTLRRNALRQLYPLLDSLPSLATSPTDEDLDSQEIVMGSLHYLDVVPRRGFMRSDNTRQPSTSDRSTRSGGLSRSDSSPSTVRAPTSSAIAHYTTGLIGSTIKPPLQGHLWDEKDHSQEGTGGLYWELLLKASNGTEDTGYKGEMGSMKEKWEEEDEDEEGYEEEEKGEEDPIQLPNYWQGNEGYRASCVELHRGRRIELSGLINEKFPSLPQTENVLAKLPCTVLRDGIDFFSHDEIEGALEVKNGQYYLNRSTFYHISETATSRPEAVRKRVRHLLSHLGVVVAGPLRHQLERIQDNGGIVSPAVHHTSILPLLFITHHLPGCTAQSVLQFIYITSLLSVRWTAETPPSTEFLETELCKTPSPDSIIHCKDRKAFSSALHCLRLLADVFGLAPPLSLRTLNPTRTTDFPQLTEENLRLLLGSILEQDPRCRYKVTLTDLRKGIYAAGGVWRYGQELGRLPTGAVTSVDELALLWRLIRHCWKWVEEMVVRTVGEERFKDVFGVGIDWDTSDANGYVISKEE